MNEVYSDNYDLARMKNLNINKRNENIEILSGDLFEQEVDVIVNPWNRNIIPWWLLLPQGVSGALKKKAGVKPFNEVLKAGPIPLGNAVLTTAGKLQYKGIIHVAGINIFWIASEKSIRKSVDSAMEIVEQQRFESIAFPAIGSGSGSFNTDKSIQIIYDQLNRGDCRSRVVIVRYDNK